MVTYNQVADEDLKDLGLQASAVLERLLEEPDEEVAHRRTNESTVGSHLGNARGEIVTVLVAVLGKPRGENFLKTGESTSCEHLGPEGVLLKFLDVGL